MHNKEQFVCCTIDVYGCTRQYSVANVELPRTSNQILSRPASDLKRGYLFFSLTLKYDELYVYKKWNFFPGLLSYETRLLERKSLQSYPLSYIINKIAWFTYNHFLELLWPIPKAFSVNVMTNDSAWNLWITYCTLWIQNKSPFLRHRSQIWRRKCEMDHEM